MSAIGYLLGAIVLAIAVLLKLVLWPFERPIRRTAREVAAILRDYLEGTVSDSTWDDFVSVPIADPRLEAIRDSCVRVEQQFRAKRPTSDRGEAREYVSAQGLDIVRGHLRELVAAEQAADQAPSG